MVTVKSAVWTRRIDTSGKHLRFLVAPIDGRRNGAAERAGRTFRSGSTFRFAVPSTLQVNTNLLGWWPAPI